MGQTIVSDDCDFGWVAAWASEMGDAETLRGLLTHADRFMNPTWADGGLYYPRNDTVEDRDGNRTMIEPMSGNVLLGYARLNIPDGLWHFYNDPWEASHFEEPAVSRVGDDVDISLALFDKSANKLKLAVARRADVAGGGKLHIANAVSRGPWKFICDGGEICHGAENEVRMVGSVRADVTGQEIVFEFPRGFDNNCVVEFSPGPNVAK